MTPHKRTPTCKFFYTTEVDVQHIIVCLAYEWVEIDRLVACNLTPILEIIVSVYDKCNHQMLIHILAQNADTYYTNNRESGWVKPKF